jgi:hypothetical protein
LLWHRPFALGLPIYYAGRLCAGLAVVDQATGALLFRYDTRDVLEAGSPAVADGYVIFAGKNGLSNDANFGSIAWYRAAECGQAWCGAVKALELRDQQYFPPVVANGNVYVARDAVLQAYASPSGIQRWLDAGGNSALLVRHAAGSYVWSIDNSGEVRGYLITGCGHPKCSPGVVLHGAAVATGFLPTPNSVLSWGFTGLHAPWTE